MSQLQMVATSAIHRYPLNPRRPVAEAKTLVKPVKAHGILSPLNVMPDPEGGYLLIAGERRHFAATTNGLAEVPAVVNDYDEKQAATALAVDNLEREDLSPAEEPRCAAYRQHAAHRGSSGGTAMQPPSAAMNGSFPVQS